MAVTAEEFEDLVGIVREAARLEILPRFARLDPADVKTKSHASDFVTVADEAAERLIEKRVHERFGDVGFVGEEIFERDPSVVDRLETADRTIVVDPIDGTFNYANGIPAFAVILAVVERGETVAGILYDPIRDDWIGARQGEGAFLAGEERPARQVRVAAARPLEEMHGMVGFAYADPAIKPRLVTGVARFWGICNYRCGGQEMRLLAQGGTHFALYSKLTPWDHAAGELIHREAGGHVALVDGSAYRASNMGKGLLLAPDAETWQQIRDALLG